MQNQKPWKSYQAQLNILKARGLKVGDEAKALHYLERIGYYRLSGYWYPFRENDPVQARQKTNQFKADSYFEDAVKLYVFDKRLRLLALDALSLEAKKIMNIRTQRAVSSSARSCVCDSCAP